MAGLYIDTSSLGHGLLAEPDAAQIRQLIGAYDQPCSSALPVVECRRRARRAGLGRQAAPMLQTIDLSRSRRRPSNAHPALDPVELRSLDAMHPDAARELHTPERSMPYSPMTSDSATRTSTTPSRSQSPDGLEGATRSRQPRLPVDAYSSDVGGVAAFTRTRSLHLADRALPDRAAGHAVLSSSVRGSNVVSAMASAAVSAALPV